MFARPQHREPRVDITSLIDVAFLLVIFLVVSTTFLRERGLELSLPKAKGETQVAEKTLVVEIAPDGTIYFLNATHTKESLTKALFILLKDETTPRNILLKADRRARHGDVVRAMDAIKEAGAQGLAIAVEEENIKNQ